jgi:hypothetical protein
MNTAEQFKEKKYVVVKNAITKELAEFITQYALFDEMQDFTPDTAQVLGAHSKYADPVMESLLLKLHPLMEETTGLSLYPTYAFHRVYRNGSVLHPHKDRFSCEISTTISFCYSYDDKNYKWPIFIDGKEIVLEPGDMAIYRGIDLEHWREPFMPEEDSWHVQAFLHYVDVNGPYAEWKWDKRSSLGLLSSSKNKTIEKKDYITYVN